MPIKLLILLSLLDDFNGHKNNYLSYQAINRFLSGYSLSSIRVNVNSLLKSGDLEKIIKDGIVYFSLSSTGFKTISEKFLRPASGLKRKWDRKWRVIVFDVPESERAKRARLRQILNNYSFGRIANSVYISPFNTLELTSKTIREILNDTGELFAFEMREVFGDKKQIASRAFFLDDISQKYNEWIKRTKTARGKFDIITSYYDLVSKIDPALPEELLPADWPLTKSWNIFIGFLASTRE